MQAIVFTVMWTEVPVRYTTTVFILVLLDMPRSVCKRGENSFCLPRLHAAWLARVLAPNCLIAVKNKPAAPGPPQPAVPVAPSFALTPVITVRLGVVREVYISIQKSNCNLQQKYLNRYVYETRALATRRDVKGNCKSASIVHCWLVYSLEWVSKTNVQFSVNYPA